MITSGMVMVHEALAPLMVDIDSVHQHPDNYNNGDEDAIAASIETNGMYRPIFAQTSTGAIIAGNHVWATCKRLGATRIPVLHLDTDDIATARIMIADNRIASLAVPDPGLLLDLLDKIVTADSLLGTGYTENNMEVLRHIADIDLNYTDNHPAWPGLCFHLPPDAREAFYRMTDAALGDVERFLLLLRLAGWDGD